MSWDTGPCCIEREVSKQEECNYYTAIQLMESHESIVIRLMESHESIVIWLMESHESIAVWLLKSHEVKESMCTFRRLMVQANLAITSSKQFS